MKKNISLTLVMSLIVLLIGTGIAGADRGSIPFIPHVNVFEPLQRAVIAWNGEEQILILSTDLSASERVKVLEVLPIPAEPEVKEGDIEVFTRIQKLIRKKMWHDTSRPGFRSGGTSPQQEAGEITLHEKIGAHDISVANVIRPEDFVVWANNYLKSLGVETPTIPEPMKNVIQEYIDDGYYWFVFDVVELEEEPKTNQAIQYQFKTEELFFPMRITRTETGETKVDIQAIMPRLRPEVKGLLMRTVNPTVLASQDELKDIDPDIYQLFCDQEDVAIHSWYYRGQLASFTEDIKIGINISEEVYSYGSQLYSNCEKRQPDPDILSRENEVLCGEIGEVQPEENLFYRGAALDERILIDAYTEKPLKNYRLLLGEEVTIHGYSGDIELTLKDFQSSTLDEMRLRPQDEKKANEKNKYQSVFFVTRIEEWNFLCGKSYLIDRYNLSDQSRDFCFWHQ